VPEACWRTVTDPGALSGRCGGLERVHDFNRIRIQFQELANDDIRFEADRMRVRANECPAKNAGRPMRHIVPLQSFEQGDFYFRLLSDRRESDLLLLTAFAQACAKTVRHAAYLGPRQTQP
jgi:hypothetical protein